MSALADRFRLSLDQHQSRPLLDGDDFDGNADQPAIPAAVLVAITDRASPGMILTVRREHMRTHAGQVAFPGGTIDDGEGAIAAALREANEELGLDPANVTIIGALDPYRTITWFEVTPVLGIIPPGLALEPHEHEVADWFEAPLDFVLNPSNQHRRTALFRGRDRHYYEINWNGRKIWGATAAMIVNLSLRLQWP
ncbi:MAG: CoA pyrophosphatase [Sphingomonas sp.]|nr:CoA pyrophosphatase [Sphingomonas sp.]